MTSYIIALISATLLGGGVHSDHNVLIANKVDNNIENIEDTPQN